MTSRDGGVSHGHTEAHAMMRRKGMGDPRGWAWGRGAAGDTLQLGDSVAPVPAWRQGRPVPAWATASVAHGAACWGNGSAWEQVAHIVPLTPLCRASRTGMQL